MVRVVEDVFGSAVNPFTKQPETIRRFTISNDRQMSVQVITLGATITSLKVPDAGGSVDDVVLGYDDVAGYQTSSNPYFGATIGRVCNRVANGRFELDGQTVEVSRNFNNKHQLHGGFVGFDKAHWEVVDVDTEGGAVAMRHRSPDGDEGYPGELLTTVRFSLAEDNCLHVRMEAEMPAVTTAAAPVTVVNLTNHSYFNLAGHAAGRPALCEHEIQIRSGRITETNAESIPTGELREIEDTPYDLRTLGNLGRRLELLPGDGFDNNYCVGLTNQADTVVAKAVHPRSGRWLEVATNQPGVQFYTANYFPDPAKGEEPLIGKAGAQYVKQGAFCLETQKYPDAVNHTNFPSIVLRPGQKYNHEVTYRFGVDGRH